MSEFETLYLIFGSYIISAGAVMVLVYTLTNPWWRNLLGRMLVTYAVAEIIMSTLLMITVVGHITPYWFRAAWFVLQTVVGSTFWFQTWAILKLHRERPRTGETP
jgi:hypothetical protein